MRVVVSTPLSIEVEVVPQPTKNAANKTSKYFISTVLSVLTTVSPAQLSHTPHVRAKSFWHADAAIGLLVVL
jgi:hypothetical protein